MRLSRSAVWLPAVLAMGSTMAQAPLDQGNHLRPIDVFGLEYASDPRVSPDGKQIVFVRNQFDIMTDRPVSSLWMLEADGKSWAITTGNQRDRSPRWSPTGDRLLYTSNVDGSSQLYVRWTTGKERVAKLTQLTQPARGFTWSRDGQHIAFVMLVPHREPPMIKMPAKPKGAKWAAPARVIRKLRYRSDGNPGFVPDGHWHVFVLPANGGTPRQLTRGNFNHGSISWGADSDTLYCAANRQPDAEYSERDTEIYSLRVRDGRMDRLTDRRGPDTSPTLSPDGKTIAYLGYDDELKGFHPMALYVMNADGSGSRKISPRFSPSIQSPQWDAGSTGLYVQYARRGKGRIGYISANGAAADIVADVGGTTLGRPYDSGSFHLAAKAQRIAYTATSPQRPADVVAIDLATRMKALTVSPDVANRTGLRPLTRLNEDLLAHKQLATNEAFECKSTHDGEPIQGWVLRPPGFDKDKMYPMILEIHGGPFANYGPRFSAEMQLFAAAGYVVVYVNPRGSTSYGPRFANLIHHAYPGNDYDDLMTCVQHVIGKGGVDSRRLYVTGGSGGGVLTAWIVGKTRRFRAAVVAKPVINWYSFVLTADGYPFFHKYWFPGLPWDNVEHYHRRSPISLVGKVATPTMLLTGEQDFRTPMSETEQYYNALKLRKVDTALVRIPGAGHGIAARPSHLIAKVAHILAWFERYGGSGKQAGK